MFKTVLFPVDQNRETREAADVVVNVVQTYKSRLILLYVLAESAPEAESPPEKALSPGEIEELLQTAKALFQEQGIESETMTREGMPPFTICDVADEIGADLIIMGCRGLGLTEEGASESVTNRVINLSPCPVLVVP